MLSAQRAGERLRKLIKSAGAGFLAGALSFLVLLVAVEFLFFLGGFMSMLGELAKLHGLGMEEQYQLTPQLFLLGLLNAGATAVGHIWAIRLGFLPLGAIGAVTGAIQHLAGRLGRRRAHRVGLLAMVAMMNVVILAWELGRRQKISELLIKNPQYFAWQEMLLESLPTTLIVGLVLAFLAAYLLWEVWRWWYRRLAPLLRLREPRERVGTGESRRWLQVSGVALGFCLLSLMPAFDFYQREGPDTISGQKWLDLNTSWVAVPLKLEKRPERMAVSNVQGLGQVEVCISDKAQEGTPLRRGKNLTLSDDIHQYSYTEISLVGLPPATYYLHLAISGHNARGLMRYIVLEQGTGLMGLAAWTLTLLLIGALVSALILVFEVSDLV